MEMITNVWDRLMINVPNYVEALILLVLAMICASIIKSLVNTTMNVLKLDSALDKAKIDDNKKTSLKEFVAKLFYLITFVLFVPGIFGKLGLTGVSEPVVSMMNELLTYLPNIIAAVIILIIGLCISKGVRELLIPTFKKLNFDKFLEKAGVDGNNKVGLSEVLANIVYVLILIPVVIASLDALKIEAISKPATDMLNNILVFMPRVLIAIVIVYIGKFIAGLACGLLEKLLVSIGTDKVTQSIMDASDTKVSKDFSLSKIIANIIKIVIIVFFVVEGVNILQLQVLTNIGNNIIAYMPYAVSSVIIMLIAILVGNFAESSINKKFKDNKAIAFIAKVAIVVVGVFVTLYQLGIAKSMVNSAFIIILGAFAVAFAIAFGVGGRDFAKSMLSKLEKKIDGKSKK
ncbi:MAG: mechanosensitive ion channel [Bacilli bacterium]|nr:mechanosensitive ion channel [Bacilli bacterium]